ncbi:MAG: hypothetical protein ACD_59C00053G0010 [uncultured bacterium]|nr:MAG: hypothetical protein ACD_59C00053G0010 [uncultured bacterium]
MKFVKSFKFKELDINFYQDQGKDFSFLCGQISRAVKISPATISYHVQRIQRLQELTRLIPAENGRGRYQRIISEQGVYVLLPYLNRSLSKAEGFADFIREKCNLLRNIQAPLESEVEPLEDSCNLPIKKDKKRVAENIGKLIESKMSQYYRIIDVSKLFKVDKQTVNDWIEKKIINCFELGTLKLISKTEIEKVVNML